MNSVNLIGRLGNDVDTRYLESGKVVASFRLAISEGKDSPPTWVSVECWEKTAEIAATYLSKGRQVAVSGRLKEQTWTDRVTNEKRSKLIVVGDRLTLLGDRSESAPGTPQPAPAPDLADCPF